MQMFSAFRHHASSYILMISICFVGAAFSQLMYAQENSTKRMDEVFLYDVSIVWEDGLSYFLAPLTFTQRDWIVASGVVAGTAGLMLVDEDLQEIPRNNQDAGLYSASLSLTRGGDLLTAEIVSGLVYFTGLISEEDEIRVTGRMLGQSLIYAGSVALALRILSGRRWPAAHLGAYEFDFIQLDDTYQSFPSGHTVVAFSMATVLAQRFDHWIATALLYSGAAAVALGRIYVDQHWTSDIFLGAALGYLSGMYVSTREKARQAASSETQSWMLVPASDGLSLVIRL